MEKALQVAASGMLAQKLYIDVIANNLANVNTTGFKNSTLQFQDLLYETIQAAGDSTGPESKLPSSLQVGNGTRVVSTLRNFEQGPITETGNPLDLAINGDGFLQIRLPDGTFGYTRDGSLKISGDGTLVTSNGYIVEPEITIPQDAQQINIRTDGQVEVKVFGEVDAVPLGRIELTRFINPAGLNSIGKNLYIETSASGSPYIGTAGQDGFGDLNQRYLEKSNVDVVRQMVDMIEAQRAYEINSKTIRTAQSMYEVENRIR